jgi:hypothetical protein
MLLREVDLGTEQELWAANHDIFNATGGSSAGVGSRCFLGSAQTTRWTTRATRLGVEATEFIELYDLALRRETLALLERLSGLAATPSSTRS